MSILTKNITKTTIPICLEIIQKHIMQEMQHNYKYPSLK